jgi:hypothetical protein
VQYNGSTYITLDDPNAVNNQFFYGTTPQAICDNYVVGSYSDSGYVYHGFLYNISTQDYTTLDDPMVGAQGITGATGIDGDTVFGEYKESSTSGYYQPFLYDIATAAYTTLNIDLPGPIFETGGISGNTVVGTYSDPVTDYSHGFVATIPEPSSFSLLCGGVGCLFAYRLRRRMKMQLERGAM